MLMLTGDVSTFSLFLYAYFTGAKLGYCFIQYCGTSGFFLCIYFLSVFRRCFSGNIFKKLIKVGQGVIAAFIAYVGNRIFFILQKLAGMADSKFI